MVSFDNWYVGVGGQSNGTRLQFYGGDGASGQTVLAGILRSAGLSSNVSVANHTLGSSAIDGDNYYMNDTRPGAYWWQLASGTPGPALVDAVERMRQDIANLGPGATKVSMVWSIGETDAEMLRRGLSDTARFKEGMVATFRHIEQQLGVDIDFYLIQTGRFQPPAGEDPAHYISKTLAHEAIQQAQAELAAEHADIHLAAVTKHLEMDDSGLAPWEWRGGMRTSCSYGRDDPLHVGARFRRGTVAQGRVQALPVVEHLHILEYCCPGLRTGMEAGVMDVLLLERGKEALHRSVVETIAAPAHRLPDGVPLQHATVGLSGILHTPIAVVGQAPRRPPMLQGHDQGVDAQLGP